MSRPARHPADASSAHDERRVYDVLVAGAGLPGLAAAAALARTGLAVAIVDRAPICAEVVAEPEWDLRVYAISPGSAAFLGALGAWQALPLSRIAPVEAMDVAGDAGGRVTFDAYQLGERALAWIVEERELRSALVAAVHAAGVDVLAAAPFARLTFAPEHAELALDDGRRVEARLVVGADGLRSWIRHAAGIVAAPSPYGQRGVVAHFTTEAEHRGIAHQWFLGQDGVLAWLPLPGRRMSIVWSAPDALAAELVAMPAADLARRVEIAGARTLGTLAPLVPAAAFPLAYLRLPAVVAHRLALVGDAAHGVHPLAGQGVNLGFGDAAELARAAAARGPVTDAGSPALLARYACRRAEPVLAMQAATDGLARLFGLDRGWLRTLRNAGMATVERIPALKRALAQPALR
ncbi:MAG: FAD-dependent monooxygenase [Proteobacteria bacterium]|nr:FAD-dependent monooxygenase [Pseudomonadota bacterium]